MNATLRWGFFALFVRPLVLVLIGLRIRDRERLPAKGPAILVANHNSHLDAPVLISLFPQRMLPGIRPVAAADYFLKSRALAWFSTRIMGVIPINRQRGSAHEDVLKGVSEALDRGDIVILFPEGTRGEPEQLSEFKAGVAHLSKRHPEVPVVPVFLHGLGKSLPKDESILVPFFCDVFVGEPLSWTGDRGTFMEILRQRMLDLSAQENLPAWE